MADPNIIKDPLVEELLSAVRKLIAAGESRSDIEGIVVQELLRDD